MKEVHIINGPNLNLLGKREISIYGKENFDDYFDQLKGRYKHLLKLDYFQSNQEGEIIDYIHRVGFSSDGIIINPAAYTHTSIAIADALKAISLEDILEVHISNIASRESFRHTSYVSPICLGTISGFGLFGYEMALHWFCKVLKRAS